MYLFNLKVCRRSSTVTEPRNTSTDLRPAIVVKSYRNSNNQINEDCAYPRWFSLNDEFPGKYWYAHEWIRVVRISSNHLWSQCCYTYDVW